MKKEILDEPFQSSFSIHMEKDEEIIWEKEHQKEFPFSLIIISSLLLLMWLYCFTYNSNIIIFQTLFMISFFSVPFIFIKFKEKKELSMTKYALTQKRIILQEHELSIYSIPIEDIGRVNVRTNSFDKQKGDLFLLIKNAKKKKYKVYDRTIPENYGKVPMIRQVHNPHEVARLIRQGIKF